MNHQDDPPVMRDKSPWPTLLGQIADQYGLMGALKLSKTVNLSEESTTRLRFNSLHEVIVTTSQAEFVDGVGTRWAADLEWFYWLNDGAIEIAEARLHKA